MSQIPDNEPIGPRVEIEKLLGRLIWFTEHNERNKKSDADTKQRVRQKIIKYGANKMIKMMERLMEEHGTEMVIRYLCERERPPIMLN